MRAKKPPYPGRWFEVVVGDDDLDTPARAYSVRLNPSRFEKAILRVARLLPGPGESVLSVRRLD